MFLGRALTQLVFAGNSYLLEEGSKGGVLVFYSFFRRCLIEEFKDSEESCGPFNADENTVQIKSNSSVER